MIICEIHNIEKNKMEIETQEQDESGNLLFDEFGNPISKKIEIYECPVCEEDKIREEEGKFYSDQSYFETTFYIRNIVKKIENKNPGNPTLREQSDKKNFIELYAPIISRLTDASLDASRAMSQFLISCSLLNTKYSNSKGLILPNISFIWVSPSGSNKTPLIDLTIKKLLPEIYPEFTEFGSVTGKGFRKEISKNNKEPFKPIVIVWDEMSTLAKDAKHDGTSDIYEVLSEAFDGKLSPYTSVRGGHETYPPLYASFWLSGVPSFLEHTDKSFWFQGFGLRSLFLKYDIAEIKDIKDDVTEEIEEFYRNIKMDLSIIKEINVVKTTPEFMERYNSFRKEVLTEIQKCQKDIIRSQDPEIYDSISKVKYPILVVKLAMINAASRWNFTEDGLLILDVPDIESAIKDLEKYHENFMAMFNVWQELIETKLRIDSIKNIKDKIIKHIKSLSSEKGFSLVKEGESYRATAGKGKWVSHASLLRSSHFSSKNFNEIIKTLIEQMVISKKEGFIEKNGIKYPIIFYSERIKN